MKMKWRLLIYGLDLSDCRQVGSDVGWTAGIHASVAVGNELEH